MNKINIDGYGDDLSINGIRIETYLHLIMKN